MGLIYGIHLFYYRSKSNRGFLIFLKTRVCKNQKVFACSCELLTNSKSSLSNPLQNTYSCNFEPENTYVQKAASDPENDSGSWFPVMMCTLEKSTNTKKVKTNIGQWQRRNSDAAFGTIFRMCFKRNKQNLYIYFSL
jgi:hypothetical protein